jgi:hypothetical protein
MSGDKGIPGWALALLVIPAVCGFAGMIATARGLNKPADQRRGYFLTGAALTVVAGALFLIILGVLA